MAMELAEGSPLSEVIARQASLNTYFETFTLIDILRQICGAVSHAHSRLIVHRDIKPQNVMVDDGPSGPFVKVLDFGVARLMAGNLFDATTFGRRIGSVFYMAPEQVRGEPADVVTDVFALGSVFFEMVTLRRAWARDQDGSPAIAFARPVPRTSANSLDAVVERILRGPRPQASSIRPELPSAIDSLIERSLAVDPKERPTSVDAFFRELTVLLDVDSEAYTRISKSVGEPRTVSESATIEVSRQTRQTFADAGPTLLPPPSPLARARVGEDTLDETPGGRPREHSSQAGATVLLPGDHFPTVTPRPLPHITRQETTRAEMSPEYPSTGVILLIMAGALVLGVVLMIAMTH